jgi:hypothetical protein
MSINPRTGRFKVVFTIMGRVYAYVNVLLVVKLKLVEVNVAKTKNKFNMYRL